MVKTIEMKNKDNEPMMTLEGKQMYKHTLECGDTFIPLWQKPISEMKGEALYPRLTMKCRFEGEGEPNELIIDLTPTQYKSLIKKTEENKEVYNKIFVSYKAYSEVYKVDFVAIGYESSKDKLKSFQELRGEKNPTTEDFKDADTI